jgi:hypothetical protein
MGSGQQDGFNVWDMLEDVTTCQHSWKRKRNIATGFSEFNEE